MHRRQFLQTLVLSGLSGWLPLGPSLAVAGQVMAAPGLPNSRRLLILVELKGGNDGLNTLVPFADPRYVQLRPRLAIKPEAVLPLNEHLGLHPSLAALLPLWQSRQLAIVQSVGYPEPNLSHFRSIEIWDTASRSNQYLHEGWLARTFAQAAPPASFIADGAAIGASELGPLQGSRAVVLNDPEKFRRQAMQMEKNAPPGHDQAEMQAMAMTARGQRNAALQHVLSVENNIQIAAHRLEGQYNFQSSFPKSGFGDTVRTACRVIAAGQVAALRLTLSGFDTHQNQAGTHGNLLRQLAEGLVALQSGLTELGRWDETLVLTYAEFGRRPQENQSGGTDHGTAAPHLVLGGRVRGGLYGSAPNLNQLDRNGNLQATTDFRQLYATVLKSWWGLGAAQSEAILGGVFPVLPLV